MIKSIKYIFSSLLCTISSYSPVVVFYIIGSLLSSPSKIELYAQFIIIGLLSLCCIIIAIAAKSVAKTFSINDSASITAIRPIESNAIPTYLGLFVISLGINNLELSGASFILFVLFVMWRRFERVCYFNPLWSLLGLHFYEFETKQNGSFFLVTKRRDFKNNGTFGDLKRINNYTFMEV